MTETPEAVRLADSIKPLADAPIVAWCIESTDSADWCWSATRDGVIYNAKFLDDGCEPGEPFAVIRQADHQAQMNALLRRIPEIEAERDQLRAELDARWQPIETATEEDESGGQAWLLVDGVVVRGYFLSIPFQEYRDADGFYCGQQDADAYWARVEDGEPVSPTHFQRITPPAAPTPPNADQKGQ